MDVAEWAERATRYALLAGKLQAEANATGSGEKMIRAITARAMANGALAEGFAWVGTSAGSQGEEAPADALRRPGDEAREGGEE